MLLLNKTLNPFIILGFIVSEGYFSYSRYIIFNSKDIYVKDYSLIIGVSI
jgi:hypothetical protein